MTFIIVSIIVFLMVRGIYRAIRNSVRNGGRAVARQVDRYNGTYRPNTSSATARWDNFVDLVREWRDIIRLITVGIVALIVILAVL